MDMQMKHKDDGNRKQVVTGLALMALGLWALVGQFVQMPDMGMLFLPALGLIFVVWGIAVREGGLMIPGGILSGVGVGAYLVQVLPVEGSADGGLFLLSLGLGFAAITVLTAVFTDNTHWWALWPGAILSLIGGALLLGGVALSVLAVVGTYWPVILIVIGVWVIVRSR
jgi:hypothetical protein